MNTKIQSVPAIVLLLTAIIALAGDKDAPALGAKFTGEILTALYVTDVRKSVAFYKALGFEHDYFYDYQTEIYTRDWKQPYSPDYAEMTQVGIRLSLTTADEKYQVYGGGVRHYFIVDDVDKHFEMAKKNGITAAPNEVEVRPWMSFITVVDPDNHQIVFATKNQTYYDSAREQIKNIERHDSQER